MGVRALAYLLLSTYSCGLYCLLIHREMRLCVAARLSRLRACTHTCSA
eukprot:COSAG01_NODE_3789_length_5692_cov_82.776685_5_plen_48_part_00